MLYRNTEDSDLEYIQQALVKWETISPDYGYVDKPNKDKAYSYIYKTHLLGDAYIVDNSFLLLVASITPWFGDDKILQEQLVLSLKPGGHLAFVLVALDCIALDRGDTKVLLSDSSVGLKLSPYYERNGYRRVTHQFVKEA